MICSLLCYKYNIPAELAMSFYADRRTYNNKVNVPISTKTNDCRELQYLVKFGSYVILIRSNTRRVEVCAFFSYILIV